MKNRKYEEGLEFERKYDQALLFKDSLEKKAVAAYKDAAREGNVFSQYRLAVYYSNGSLKDKELNDHLNNDAIYWLKNAANGGYEKAILDYANYAYKRNWLDDAFLYYEDLYLYAYPNIWDILYDLYKRLNRFDKVYKILAYKRLEVDVVYWPYEEEYQRLHKKYKDVIHPYVLLSDEDQLDINTYESILYAYKHNPEAFDIFDLEKLVLKDISNKPNQFIYLSSRKKIRDYYRDEISKEENDLNPVSIVDEAFDLYFSILEEHSGVQLSDNPFVWDNYDFVNEKNAWALACIADLYLDGLGVPRNLNKAFEMLSVAYEKHASDVATIRLADCYYMGYGVDVDMNKAYELYTSALMFDSGKWCSLLDDSSLNRDVGIAWSAYLTKRYDVSYPLLKKVIEEDHNHHSSLVFAYAYSNENGLGCKVDDALAAKYYELNIRVNAHTSSMNNLGLLYLSGEGVEKEYKKAFELFKKSNEKYSDKYNRYNLGRCYYHGWGIEKDYHLAFSYFIQNKDTDHSWSKRYLGLCYRFGYGVEKNDTFGFNYLFEANKHINDNKTKYELARCYYYGKGIDENKAQSVGYFLELVNDNYKYAYNYLGLCYLNGYGVEKDTAFAYELFKQANKLNQTSATLYNIGLCYEKGYGVDMDINQALEYYQQSSNLGGEKAKKKLEKYL